MRPLRGQSQRSRRISHLRMNTVATLSIGRSGIRDARWQRVPAPGQRAGVDVVGTDHAGRHVGAERILDTAANDDEVADDDWRRADCVIAGTIAAESSAQIERAALAEPRTRFAGGCIELEQTAIERARDDAAATRLALLDPRRLEIGHATAVEQVQTAHVDLRVVCPDLAAGFGIERDDLVAARAEIEPPLGENRRRLERGVFHALRRHAFGEHAPGVRPRRRRRRLIADGTDPIGPGDVQITHVGRRDLRQRRMPLAARVVAPHIPAGGRTRIVHTARIAAGHEQQRGDGARDAARPSHRLTITDEP